MLAGQLILAAADRDKPYNERRYSASLHPARRRLSFRSSKEIAQAMLEPS
jgi:hypothetical protein